MTRYLGYGFAVILITLLAFFSAYWLSSKYIKKSEEINYSIIGNDETYRLAVDSLTNGCIKHSPQDGRQSCICITNYLIEHLTKEEFFSNIAAFSITQRVRPDSAFDKAITKCDKRAK